MERKFPIYIAVDDVHDTAVFEFINSKAMEGSLISFVTSLIRGYVLSEDVRRVQDNVGGLSAVSDGLDQLQRSNTMQGTLSGMMQDFNRNQAHQLFDDASSGVSPATTPSAQDTQAFLQNMVSAEVQKCIQSMVWQCLSQGMASMSQPAPVGLPSASFGSSPQSVPQVSPQPFYSQAAPVQQPAPVQPAPVQPAPVQQPAPNYSQGFGSSSDSGKPVVSDLKPKAGTPAAFGKLLGSM